MLCASARARDVFDSCLLLEIYGFHSFTNESGVCCVECGRHCLLSFCNDRNEMDDDCGNLHQITCSGRRFGVLTKTYWQTSQRYCAYQQMAPMRWAYIAGKSLHHCGLYGRFTSIFEIIHLINTFGSASIEYADSLCKPNWHTLLHLLSLLLFSF